MIARTAMTSQEYSERSRSVRSAAKDLLRKFRDERRQRDSRAAPGKRNEAPPAAAEAIPESVETRTNTSATLRASARAEMLARAAALAAPSAETEAEEEPAAPIAEDVVEADAATASAEDGEAVIEAPSDEPDEALSADDSVSSTDEPAEQHAEEAAEEPADEPSDAPAGDVGGDEDAPSADAQLTSAQDASESPTPRTASAPEPSDLDEVPGIGPGLIWVLQQAGVNSLDALAHADAVELRLHLGVIGELVDIQSWIEWAKTRDS